MLFNSILFYRSGNIFNFWTMIIIKTASEQIAWLEINCDECLAKGNCFAEKEITESFLTHKISNETAKIIGTRNGVLNFKCEMSKKYKNG